MGVVHIEEGGQLLLQNWKFQRGDIYFTRFDHATGSEQSGNRPAVVLQNDVGNFYSPTLESTTPRWKSLSGGFSRTLIF